VRRARKVDVVGPEPGSGTEKTKSPKEVTSGMSARTPSDVKTLQPGTL
jgi:hypothetical protein